MSRRLGRLLSKADFKDILKNGSRQIHQGLVMTARPSTLGPRLGFAIGRAAGTAVQRNRLRRVIREQLRQALLPSVDIVITLRGPIGGLRNAEIRQQLIAVLHKMGWVI